jgi:gliding motility-associated protein GldM
MSIPKEPRQQMINMMYLVLTALLALNVSAEVLNAFKLVGDGMNYSNSVVDQKNTTVLKTFASATASGTDEQKQWFASAQQAEKMAKDFDAYIVSLREELVMASGGWLEGSNKEELKVMKNYDGPTLLMIKKGKGKELEAAIAKLKADLLALPGLSPEDVKALTDQITLTTAYNEANAKKLGKKDWSAYHFDHVPIVAVNTLLYKFQSDAVSSAGLVMEALYKKIGEAKYDFDQLNATISADASYVMKGDPYMAKIFLTASSSSTTPEILLGQIDRSVAPDNKKVGKNPIVGGGSPVAAEQIKSGVWEYEDRNTGAAGERAKSGAIKVPKPGSKGEFEYYPFEFRYNVADLGVAVSPDKMNVFYIGVDNPVTITVTGMTSDKVSASLTGGMGTIKKVSGSEYTVNVNKVGETEVAVTGVGPDGKSKQLDTKKFRVKRVPDPIAKVGTSAGGKVPAAQFKVQRGVIPVLEDFVFDIKFVVVSFEITYAAKRQDLITKKATSGAFTGEMIELLNRSKPGDVFYLDEVRVKGPDGQIRKLPSIAYTLI